MLSRCHLLQCSATLRMYKAYESYESYDLALCLVCPARWQATIQLLLQHAPLACIQLHCLWFLRLGSQGNRCCCCHIHQASQRFILFCNRPWPGGGCQFPAHSVSVIRLQIALHNWHSTPPTYRTHILWILLSLPAKILAQSCCKGTRVRKQHAVLNAVHAPVPAKCR